MTQVKIDFRKASQYIGNVYVWKEKDGYGTGINGTSLHFKVGTREELFNKINFLLSIK